jgi:flagellin
MSLGVLNNLNAIYAENNLNNTNNSLSKTLQQLSSGSRINSGADDAAGLSLVNGLQANQTALTQSETNATEGVGLLQVADGALSQVTSLLNRAVTLATEASNGTLNSTQDAAANQEYQSILSEINNIGATTTYNQQQVFGSNTNIYTGDSSTQGASIDSLNIRSLSASNVGDTGGIMSYSNGENNVFLNLSSSSANAALTDTLNGGANGSTTLNINYLVPGGNGASSTATTQISVGAGTSYANTVSGLVSAVNDAGLGLSASFADQSQAGVQGGGSQTGIQISGGIISAGVDPSSVSTSGVLDPSGIPAGQLLTQGQQVTVNVGGTAAASVTIDSSVTNLQQLAQAINTATANGGTGSPSSLVKATVVTNSDGTQSLALADSNSSGGALSVSTSGGAAMAPVFANNGTGTAATNYSAMSTVDTTNATGVATVNQVLGAYTVGVGSVSADNTVAGSFVVTMTPSGGSAVSETFVMGGSGGTDGGSTGAYNSSTHTFTVNGNTLADLQAAISAQDGTHNTADLGVTLTAGSNGTTAFTLAGAAGSTVSIDASGGSYTNTVTGATPAMSAATNASGVASLSVAQSAAGTDSMTGSITLANGSGSNNTFTFVMGDGTNDASTNTYYTGNLTSGELGGDSANSLAGLKDLINLKMTSVTASLGAAGLTVTSKAAGTDVVGSANSLANTNAAVGFYQPTLNDLSGAYSTGLLALVNSDGSSITGTIDGSATLNGSITLTNGTVSDTFVMGNGPNGGSGLDGIAQNASGGNTIYTGANTLASLVSAINGSDGVTGDTLDLSVSTGGPNGGLYLQSTDPDTTMSMSASTLAVEQTAGATNAVSHVNAVAGSASTVSIGTGAAVNTSDVLSGSVILTNTPTSGSAVTETFVMGTSANDGSGAGTLSGTTFTVNGNTLADLQNAINSQTTAGAGSLGLGLTALASTVGLSVSTSTDNGNTVSVGTNSLTDTQMGTNSSINMGTYASLNDAVSGNFSIKVGTGATQNINLTSGETVQGMINQINHGGYGVTASWVAPTGSQNFGSILLKSSTPGTAGNITSATENITDTPTASNLSYAAAGAYSMGVSGSIADTTSGQSAASFVSNSRAGSGIATISYSDSAGQSLTATSLANQTNAEAALTTLNAAISDVAAQDGYIGAQINTLNSVSQVMGTQQQNIAAAQNAVQATDYAQAASDMSKYEILSQTGISALAQANSVQQEVTKLLQ